MRDITIQWTWGGNSYFVIEAVFLPLTCVHPVPARVISVVILLILHQPDFLPSARRSVRAV